MSEYKFSVGEKVIQIIIGNPTCPPGEYVVAGQHRYSEIESFYGGCNSCGSNNWYSLEDLCEKIRVSECVLRKRPDKGDMSFDELMDSLNKGLDLVTIEEMQNNELHIS